MILQRTRSPTSSNVHTSLPLYPKHSTQAHRVSDVHAPYPPLLLSVFISGSFFKPCIHHAPTRGSAHGRSQAHAAVCCLMEIPRWYYCGPVWSHKPWKHNLRSKSGAAIRLSTRPGRLVFDGDSRRKMPLEVCVKKGVVWRRRPRGHSHVPGAIVIFFVSGAREGYIWGL